MTKKHFIDAAEIVRNILNGGWTNDPPSWADKHRMTDAFEVACNALSDENIELEDCNYTRAVQTAEAFISLFSDANPRFDTQRFLIACGLVQAPAKVKRSRKQRNGVAL